MILYFDLKRIKNKKDGILRGNSPNPEVAGLTRATKK